MFIHEVLMNFDALQRSILTHVVGLGVTSGRWACDASCDHNCPKLRSGTRERCFPASARLREVLQDSPPTVTYSTRVLLFMRHVHHSRLVCIIGCKILLACISIHPYAMYVLEDCLSQMAQPIKSENK